MGVVGTKKEPCSSGSANLADMKNTKTRQSNGATKRHKCEHFTRSERIKLEVLAKELYQKRRPNFSDLARRLGKHHTTISREYKRGLVINRDTELREFWVYSSELAHLRSLAVMLNKGPRSKLTTSIAEDLRNKIVEQKCSPYRASIELKKEGKHQWVPSPRSIYYAIDEGLIGVKRKDLPYRPKAGKRGSNGRRMANTNTKGRPINERPKSGLNTVIGRSIREWPRHFQGMLTGFYRAYNS